MVTRNCVGKPGHDTDGGHNAAAFAVFAVIPSTELLRVPSIDKEQTKMVKIMPNTQTIEDFKNLDKRSICILFEMLDIIPKGNRNKQHGNDKIRNKIPNKTYHK